MSLNKIITIFVIIFFLFVGIIFYQLNRKSTRTANNTPLSQQAATAKVTIHNATYKVIVAKTQQEHELGLSNKPSLAKDQGMLFLFDTPDFQRFWMKDMKFPIDIIFINKNKVITIIENAPAPKSTQDSLPLYSPDEPVDTVLEINAGQAKANTIKKGDTVTIAL